MTSLPSVSSTSVSTSSTSAASQVPANEDLVFWVSLRHFKTNTEVLAIAELFKIEGSVAHFTMREAKKGIDYIPDNLLELDSEETEAQAKASSEEEDEGIRECFVRALSFESILPKLSETIDTIEVDFYSPLKKKPTSGLTITPELIGAPEAVWIAVARTTANFFNRMFPLITSSNYTQSRLDFHAPGFCASFTSELNPDGDKARFCFYQKRNVSN